MTTTTEAGLYSIPEVGKMLDRSHSVVANYLKVLDIEPVRKKGKFAISYHITEQQVNEIREYMWTLPNSRRGPRKNHLSVCDQFLRRPITSAVKENANHY